MVSDLDIVPYPIKKLLEEMTMVEEMLISPILPIMSVYRLPNGQNVLRGHMANFVQDISDLVKVLPRMTNTLPVLIVKKKRSKNCK